mmetsp:Transcript_4240/g.7086  ORF Transcript_4240/g.7086 Transcript_4240/m.7086 type:complete len:651 (-) Transcript_4240:43-1995(-)
MTARRLSSCTLPTTYGDVTLRIYGRHEQDPHLWIAWLSGCLNSCSGVLCRVHDACLTSEVLGSTKCDCALQLRLAQSLIARQGGVLIYTPQEGRGIGLANKVAAYALQQEGADTVDANLQLGLPAEARSYACVPTILADIGVLSIRLLTNNPFKVTQLKSLGVVVEGRCSLWADDANIACRSYLQTKVQRMGHVSPHFPEYSHCSVLQGGSHIAVTQTSMERAGAAGAAASEVSVASACEECEIDWSSDGQQAARPEMTSGATSTAMVGTSSSLPNASTSLSASASIGPIADPSSRRRAGPSAGPSTSRIAPSAGPSSGCGLNRDSTSQQQEPWAEKLTEKAESQAEAMVGADMVSHAEQQLHDVLHHELSVRSSQLQAPPFVTLTFAQSLDGSIAGPLGAKGPRLLLSGVAASKMTHRLRAAHGAILIGVDTLVCDNPRLTVRLVPGKSPVRVVLDSKLRLPSESQLLRPASANGATLFPPVVVLTLRSTLHRGAGARRAALLRRLGVRVLAVASDEVGLVNVRAALLLLRKRLGISSVMVEGGAQVIGCFIREKLVDRLIVTVAPTFLEGLRPVVSRRTDGSGAKPQQRREIAEIQPNRQTVNGAQGAHQVLHVGMQHQLGSQQIISDLRGVVAFCLADDVVISGRFL